MSDVKKAHESEEPFNFQRDGGTARAGFVMTVYFLLLNECGFYIKAGHKCPCKRCPCVIR